MNPTVTDPLEAILRLCAAAAPKPWYPKIYAEEAGVPRDSLDPPLERLRLGGFIQLTEWVEGRGQGYALTPAGRRAVQDPRDLERLRRNPVAIPPDGRSRTGRPREGDPTTYERGELVREALLTRTTPVMGRVVLAANVLFFFYGLTLANQHQLPASVYWHLNPLAGVPAADAETYSEVLRSEGALSSLDYSKNRWWWGRLLTNCFVHFGLTHMFLNMFFLYRSGAFIEQMWGHWRFMFIYLLAGLGGSCLAVGYKPVDDHGQPILLAGASGALCGIFAAEAAWFLLNRRFMPPSLVADWTRTLVWNIFILVGISLFPGVSGAAHLGGAVVGFAVAVLLHYQRFGRSAWRWLAAAGVAVVPLLCVGSLAQAIAINPRWTAFRTPLKTVGEHNEKAEYGKRVDEAEKADHAANKAINRALDPDLLEGRVEKRDPQQVAKTAVALAQARSGLLAIADELAGVTYQDTHLEVKRDNMEQYLRKRAELCALTERYLNENREFKSGSQEVEDWKHLLGECKDLLHRWERL